MEIRPFLQERADIDPFDFSLNSATSDAADLFAFSIVGIPSVCASMSGICQEIHPYIFDAGSSQAYSVLDNHFS